MRKSFLIPALVFVALVFILPHFTYAAVSTNNFGPIVSNGATSGNDVCHCNSQGSAPDLGCILGVLQNALNIFVSFAVLMVTVFIAWAGLTYIMNPTSPEARNKANKRILNAIIGLLIVFCAWLLVDTIMKTIYNSAAGGSGIQFGPWNQIIDFSGAKDCLPTTKGGALPAVYGNNNAGGGSSVPSSVNQNAKAQCTATAFQPVFGSQAAKMSCVTRYENGSCNAGAPSGTDIGTDGKSVSWGLFQVNISANNLSQYPACEAAVGNQPLDCTDAFNTPYRGKSSPTHVTNPSLYNTCVQAVTDPTCNEEAAKTLLNNKKGIGNWGTAAQAACSSL